MNTGITNLSVSSIVVFGDNLYAATSGGGVFLSNDNGQNWKTMNTGITDLTATALITMGSNLYCSTLEDGVFLSKDNGNNWQRTRRNLCIQR